MAAGWTESQFKAQLRNAGWQSLGHGVYVYPDTGVQFQCYGYTARRGCENWRWFAVRRLLPSTAVPAIDRVNGPVQAVGET